MFFIKFKAIINIIKELADIHERFLAISEEKTKHIIEANNEEFVKLLTKERHYLQLLESAEEKRTQLVNEFLIDRNIVLDDVTTSNILSALEDEKEKKQLEATVTHLIEKIVKLKEKEQLNKDLLDQSMQLTQFSLDMLQPETKNIHYGKRNNENKERDQLSIFDSKV